jgi:site-specific DNA-methyltransferase (adenine-specific)
VKTLPRNAILAGDVGDRLAELLPESVDTVVTSPPYYQLRDYGNSGQLGLEASVDGWVAGLRDVFRLIARALKPQGSAWLNLGDSYSRHPRFGAPPKSLLAAPERLLLTLAADGWLIRNKVIWAKQNPMPTSVADRLACTYEVIYFLTRSPRYFFDLDAIRVPHRSTARRGTRSRQASLHHYTGPLGGSHSGIDRLKREGRVGHALGKNPGDVWSLPTASFRGAHFAVFPESLIERPILAACPERICVQCDRPWTRPVRTFTVHTKEGSRTIRKAGELLRCECFAPSRPGVALDPFFGSGTVGVVAERLGRDWLGIEFNPAYRELARRRIECARTKLAAAEEAA